MNRKADRFGVTSVSVMALTNEDTAQSDSSSGHPHPNWAEVVGCSLKGLVMSLSKEKLSLLVFEPNQS
jgi:hypothetical protein